MSQSVKKTAITTPKLRHTRKKRRKKSHIVEGNRLPVGRSQLHCDANATDPTEFHGDLARLSVCRQPLFLRPQGRSGRRGRASSPCSYRRIPTETSIRGSNARTVPEPHSPRAQQSTKGERSMLSKQAAPDSSSAVRRRTMACSRSASREPIVAVSQRSSTTTISSAFANRSQRQIADLYSPVRLTDEREAVTHPSYRLTIASVCMRRLVNNFVRPCRMKLPRTACRRGRSISRLIFQIKEAATL